MSYGGEQTIIPRSWPTTVLPGRADEPDLVRLNRILTLRYQIDAPEQMAPADTTVETANTKKLTIVGGTIQDGDRFRGQFWGEVTAANSTDTLLPRIRIGGLTGTVVAATPAYNADANDIVRGTFDIFFELNGADAEFHSLGIAKATGETEVETLVKDDVTLDTTADIDIVFTQDWSVNNVGNRFRLIELSGELIRTRQAWG